MQLKFDDPKTAQCLRKNLAEGKKKYNASFKKALEELQTKYPNANLSKLDNFPFS